MDTATDAMTPGMANQVQSEQKKQELLERIKYRIPIHKDTPHQHVWYTPSAENCECISKRLVKDLEDFFFGWDVYGNACGAD